MALNFKLLFLFFFTCPLRLFATSPWTNSHRPMKLNYHCAVLFHHPIPPQLQDSIAWSRHRSIVESWFAVFVIFNSSSSSTTSLLSRCAGVLCIATKDQIRKPRHQFASPCCLSKILSVFQKTGKQVHCSSIYLSIFFVCNLVVS